MLARHPIASVLDPLQRLHRIVALFEAFWVRPRLAGVACPVGIGFGIFRVTVVGLNWPLELRAQDAELMSHVQFRIRGFPMALVGRLLREGQRGCQGGRRLNWRRPHKST